MADFASVMPTYDGEEHVFAAAHHIVKALGATKNLTDDMRRLLADLDTQLSTMTKITERKVEGVREWEEQLKFAQKRVMSWESNQSSIWASGREKAADYLQAVYEIQRLTESLSSLRSNGSGKQKELLDQAHSVLQMAMERLEDELIHILKNKQSFEPEYVSFRSCEEDVVSDGSIVSTEGESIEETSRRDGSGTEHEYHVVDLVHPDVISDIKSIANVMFASNYDQEFCHAFVNFWKEALDEYFVHLRVDRLSIEDLLTMEQKCLNGKIKKWIRAMRLIVRDYLAGEKRLFEQVLGEFGPAYSTCFVEASKGSMLCLLNFGEAMAIGPRRPDEFFILLDMYEALLNHMQDIDSLFSHEAGSFIRTEFHELLTRLGETVKSTFLEFEHAVASKPSINPFPSGGIHHLTKYVMNYINTIAEYADTLNLLLAVPIGENISSDNSCPLAFHLLLLTSYLETNLDNKSRLYRDCSLKHIFMMNNIRYMVQKVEGSKVGKFFGDGWIRDYTGKFQQHETSYERVTWRPVLSLLRDDGSTGKLLLREKFKGFTIAFEEVCKSHTGWSVPDPELRKDLRISTAQKVIHAYRTFTGKHSDIIGEKNIKYTAEELEYKILDLFEGSPVSLRNSRRR